MVKYNVKQKLGNTVYYDRNVSDPSYAAGGDVLCFDEHFAC